MGNDTHTKENEKKRIKKNRENPISTGNLLGCVVAAGSARIRYRNWYIYVVKRANYIPYLLL